MVYARFENVHTDAVRMMGPFDFLQLTYTALRAGPDGDEFAACIDGWWIIYADGSQWSDVVIATED